MTLMQFSVTVVQAHLEQADRNAQASPTAAKVNFAGEEGSLVCQPVRGSDVGTYQYNYCCQFKKALSNDLLKTLVNHTAAVCIIDVETGQSICNGTIDLALLGLGESSITEVISMAPCVGSLWTVLPGSTATLSIQVQQQQQAAVDTEAPTTSLSASQQQTETMQWVPCALVPDADKDQCNVAEISIEQLGNLPPKLQAAVDAAGGRLACSLGLSIDSVTGPTTLAYLPGGTVRAQQLAWDKPLRVPLSAAAARSLLHAIQDRKPVHVELARYLQPGAEQFQDPAFSAYHGYGCLTPSELLLPGSTQAIAQVALSSTFGAAQLNGQVTLSALPPYTPPSAPKAKPIEEAPALSPDGQALGMWNQASTVFTLRLKLWRPLVPPWKPPPAPLTQLSQLLPRRDFRKAKPAVSALQQFQNKIESIAISLAKEYQDTLTGTSDAATAAPSSSTEQADVQKRLVFQLNHSGKYLQLRDALKAAVVDLVKEQFQGSAGTEGNEPAGAAAAGDQSLLHHQLFARLLDEMHAALAALKGPECPSACSEESGLEHQILQLKALADEAEVTGQMSRALALHQKRVVLSDKANPQAWYDYAGACMRAGQHGRAEECLRQAISDDPEHASSLVGLSALCLHQGSYTDAQHFRTAEIIGHALKDLFPDHPVAWAVLHLVYLAQGNDKAVEAYSCSQEVARLSQIAAVWGQSPLEQNPYMQAALLFLDMHLPDKACQALELCKGLGDTAHALQVDILLCRARAALLLGDEGTALDALKVVSRSCEPNDIRGAVLGGKLHMQAGRTEEAILEFSTAYQKHPARCPMELYLQLGRCYSIQGQHQYAKNVLLQAALLHPCASTWLGLAGALRKMGDLEGADLALTEANVLDPHNPLVWGHLALLAVQSGHVADAEQAVRYSVKEGLDEEALMLELGTACLEQDLAPMAQSVLSRALLKRDSVQVRCALAETLLAQSRQEDARQHYLAALELVTGPEDHDQVQRALEALAPFA